MSDSHRQSATSSEKYITAVSVDGIRERTENRKIMFLISVTWSDEKRWEIWKQYKDFFDLQCAILDKFPVESGKYNNERIIPHLPGRQLFRRDDISLAHERKPHLDNYIKKLINLDLYISHSKLVLDFFQEGQSEGCDDVEKLFDICKEDTSTSKTETTTQDCLYYVNTSYNPESDEKQCV